MACRRRSLPVSALRARKPSAYIFSASSDAVVAFGSGTLCDVTDASDSPSRRRTRDASVSSAGSS